MAQYIPCQQCGRMVNRILEVCPYCAGDPGGDGSGDPLDLGDGAPSRLSFIPLQAVGLLVQLLLGVFIAASVVALLTAIPYRSALLDVASGSAPGGNLGLAEDRYDTAFILVTFAYVATAAAFMTWFWRAYSNLGFLARTRSRKPGWAIGGWFIPIFGMIIPYGIGAEIWTQSRPDRGPVRERRDSNMEPVISWWALFIIMSLVNLIQAFMLAEDYDASDLAAYVGVDIVASVVAIAAAGAAIRFVRLATRRQEELLVLRRSGVS